MFNALKTLFKPFIENDTTNLKTSLINNKMFMDNLKDRLENDFGLPCKHLGDCPYGWLRLGAPKIPKTETVNIPEEIKAFKCHVDDSICPIAFLR